MAIGTTTALILGGLAIAGQVGGAAVKSKAAGKAGEIQAAASDEAAKVVTKASGDAAAGVLQTSKDAAAGVLQTSNDAAAGVDQAATDATSRVDQATGKANEVLSGIHEENKGYVTPYREAGTKALGDLAATADEKFTFSEDDPSYQFRLKEGQKALERSRAASGSLQGGGTLKALTRYGQGMASTEFQAAFDRFQADRTRRSSTLAQLAGFGQNANTQLINSGENYGNNVSQNLTRSGEYGGNAYQDAARVGGSFRVGGSDASGKFLTRGSEAAGDFSTGGARTLADLMTGKGNSQAAAKVASGNAWGNAVTGVTNTAGDIVLGRSAIQPPVVAAPVKKDKGNY